MHAIDKPITLINRMIRIILSLILIAQVSTISFGQEVTTPPLRNQPKIEFIDDQHLMLFGGYNASGFAKMNDTWIWDGKQWQERETTSNPPARGSHAMVTIPNERAVLLFGGNGENGPLNDTWIYKDNTWEEWKGDGPSPRYQHMLTYDTKRKKVVLFGGAIGRTVDSTRVYTYFNDTWEFDTNSGWSLVTETGPPPRAYGGLTYNSKDEKTVLCCGYNRENGRQSLSDTWTLDGNTWTLINEGQINPLDHIQLVTTDQDMPLTFGGWTGSDYEGETWILDKKHWSQITTVGPSPRSAYGLATNPKSGAVVLYSGWGPDGAIDDLWIFSNQRWAKIY